MTKMNRRNGTLVGLLAGLGVLAGAAPASAFKPITLELGYCMEENSCGPKQEEGGAGFEQAESDWVMDGEGNVYIVSAMMTSKYYDGQNNPWQIYCTSVKLSRDGVPELYAEGLVTNHDDADRTGHPSIAANEERNRLLVTYGTDENNNNVQVYANVLNHECQTLTQPTRISENGNANEGASNSKNYVGNKFIVGYLSQTNPDVTYAKHITITANDNIEEGFLENLVSPTDIGRIQMTYMGNNRMFYTVAKGANRPPNEGTVVGLFNTETGMEYWEEILAESNPGNDVYHNQSSLAKLSGNRVVVQSLMSDGGGKNNNNKGSNKAYLYSLTISDTGYTLDDTYTDIFQAHPTHSRIFGGQYGVGGEPVFMGISATITGSGAPVVQVGRYDGAQGGLIVDAEMERWTVGWWSDSGKLQNLYGENPNTQGRGYQNILTDIPNPAFGDQNGYAPSVETFIAANYSGRPPGNDKLSAFMTLMPGKSIEAMTPESPITPNEAELGEEGEGIDADPEADPTPDPGEEPGGGQNPPGAPQNDDFPGAPASGCACSTPGGADSSTTGALGALAMLGLAGIFVARRKED